MFVARQLHSEKHQKSFSMQQFDVSFYQRLSKQFHMPLKKIVNTLVRKYIHTPFPNFGPISYFLKMCLSISSLIFFKLCWLTCYVFFQIRLISVKPCQLFYLSNHPERRFLAHYNEPSKLKLTCLGKRQS